MFPFCKIKIFPISEIIHKTILLLAFLLFCGCFCLLFSENAYAMSSSLWTVHTDTFSVLLKVLFAAAVAAGVGAAAVAAVVLEYRTYGNQDRMTANFKLSYRQGSIFSPMASEHDVFLRSYVTKEHFDEDDDFGKRGGFGGNFDFGKGGH